MERTAEAPASLASGTSWGEDDVCEQLRIDFAGCCYLCEGMLDRSWQVEHLRPRAAFPELACAWTNLYPACAICNQRRKRWGKRGMFVDGEHRPWPVDGMLDPTGGDGIGARLLQWMETGVGVEDTRVQFAAHANDDRAASNTAEELQRLHNGDREDARMLRGYLLARQGAVASRLVTWLTSIGDARTRLQAEIRLLLGPAAPYATLMREHVIRLLAHRPELLVELGLSGPR